MNVAVGPGGGFYPGDVDLVPLPSGFALGLALILGVAGAAHLTRRRMRRRRF